MRNVLKVFVKVYKLLFAAGKDDRLGRVVSTGSINADDTVLIICSRRSGFRPVPMKASCVSTKEVNY